MENHNNINNTDDDKEIMVMKDTKGKAVVGESSCQIGGQVCISNSSALGKNCNDVSDDDSDNEEVQSLKPNSSIFDTISALVAALPGKRSGLSCFKPQNPYSSKAKNSLAVNHNGGVSKRSSRGLTLNVRIKEESTMRPRFKAFGDFKSIWELYPQPNSADNLQCSSTVGDHLKESTATPSKKIP